MRRALLALAAALALIAGAVAIPGAMMAAMLTAGMAEEEALTAVPDASLCQPDIAGSSGTGVTMAGLTGQQIQSAHTVWTVAHQTGVGDRGAIVGIATAMQESTLGANPATKRPNGDVDVGLMQQRALPGWYAPGRSVEENVRILNDDAVAARTFFEGHVVTAQMREHAARAGTQPAGPTGYRVPGLKQIKGWESMPVTVAAQAVQRSAYPTLYAKHEPLARQLVAAFGAETPNAAAALAPVLCDPPAGPIAECPATGLAIERGLTPDALRVIRCATERFGVMSGYSGVRPDSMPYHPSGRALDFMLPGRCDPLGDRIAAWAKDHAPELGVDHIIWCQKIWSPARAAEGWRLMSDRGSDTQNHRDHVHVAVLGNAARPARAAGGGDTAAPIEGCLTGTACSLSARHNQPGRAWSSGFHTGLDFAAAEGTPIRAVKAGTVTAVIWHSAYGNLTKIDHGDVESWYAHQSTTAVRPGQKVNAGQEIGKVGNTGNSFGAHLHLEIRRGGSPIDPDAWLAANGVQLTGSRA